ncbi:corepressor of Pangolin isoform 1-T2 [Cochliomyia hominivorax]
MQRNHHHQTKNQQQMQRTSIKSSNVAAATNFTNTAKLPIETVKLLIASVSRRPNLWIRTNNGQRRSDINALWQQVSEEVHLPADICRIKWGHLRDNFRKVFIRNTLSAEPPTTWRFYNDMRFMETAVAENVMRHHSLGEHTLYWQGLGQRTEQHSNSLTTSTALNNNWDASLQNPLNFSDISFFQNHKNINNENKRIKLETTESETSLQDLAQNNATSPLTTSSSNFGKIDNHFQMLHNAKKTSDVEDDDDDQFDEDAISLEENCEMSQKVENTTSKEKCSQTSIPEKICSHVDEHDSDRLFLLSLLPYLRKVKESRKLQVRQQLQNVLIQEFG